MFDNSKSSSLYFANTSLTRPSLIRFILFWRCMGVFKSSFMWMLIFDFDANNLVIPWEVKGLFMICSIEFDLAISINLFLISSFELTLGHFIWVCAEFEHCVWIFLYWCQKEYIIEWLNQLFNKKVTLLIK